jgi:GNAT superfamily N-acetyltransferase
VGLEREGQVIAPVEQASWLSRVLPGWSRTRILIHTLPDLRTLPAVGGEVTFLAPDAIAQLAVDAELLAELTRGAVHSVIAASVEGQRPVSFCYAGAETESLWDVAIDTVPEYWRRGHAARCAVHMIRHMHARGRQAVWQATDDNPASWRLAHKLGFVQVDELTLFEPAAPVP